MPALGTGATKSGVTGAGTVVVVAADNPNRRGLTFQNISDTAMWLTQTGVDPAVDAGFYIAAGQGFEVSTSQEVRVFCATAGKKFWATES